MLKAKKERLLKNFILVFVIIFAMVKMTQYNYIDLSVPADHQTRIISRIQLPSHGVSFLKRIDKSIIERFSMADLPQIRFTGILFLLLSTLPFIFLIQNRVGFAHALLPLSALRKQALLRVFRL